MKNEIPLLESNRIEMAKKKFAMKPTKKARNENEREGEEESIGKKYERFMECWSLKKENCGKYFERGLR